MAMENLHDLFMHTLKDIYFAENHVLKFHGTLTDAAQDAKLAEAFEAHRDQTRTHVERLEKAFSILGKKADGEECPAIEGITEEARELIDEISDADTRDAALVAAAQAIAHYEITRYGTLVTWAEELDLSGEVIDLLEDNLGEAEDADDDLSYLAEDRLNRKAM